MSLSITNALQISALSSPPSPTDDPHPHQLSVWEGPCVIDVPT